MANLRLPFDHWRCWGEGCDRKMQCLRFRADNTGAVNGQISFMQPEPKDCKHFTSI